MALAKNIGEPFMAHAKNLYNIPCFTHFFLIANIVLYNIVQNLRGLFFLYSYNINFSNLYQLGRLYK